jgi:hypothetical protein
VDPHCFDADADLDPAQNLDADPDPDPDPGGGGEGVGQPKMCIPPGKILDTPLPGTDIFCINARLQRGCVDPDPRSIEWLDPDYILIFKLKSIKMYDTYEFYLSRETAPLPVNFNSFL